MWLKCMTLWDCKGGGVEGCCKMPSVELRGCSAVWQTRKEKWGREELKVCTFYMFMCRRTQTLKPCTDTQTMAGVYPQRFWVRNSVSVLGSLNPALESKLERAEFLVQFKSWQSFAGPLKSVWGGVTSRCTFLEDCVALESRYFLAPSLTTWKLCLTGFRPPVGDVMEGADENFQHMQTSRFYLCIYFLALHCWDCIVVWFSFFVQFVLSLAGTRRIVTAVWQQFFERREESREVFSKRKSCHPGYFFSLFVVIFIFFTNSVIFFVCFCFPLPSIWLWLSFRFVECLLKIKSGIFISNQVSKRQSRRIGRFPCKIKTAKLRDRISFWALSQSHWSMQSDWKLT